MSIRKSFHALFFLSAMVFAGLICNASVQGAEIQFPHDYDNEADRLFEFAESLFYESDYYRAITEYKRFINYYPRDRRVDKAWFRTGMSYYQSNHLDEASTHFFRFRKEIPDSPLRITAWFYSAESLFQKHDWLVAKEEFKKMKEENSGNRLAYVAMLRLGWIDALQHKWEDAARQFHELAETDFKLLNIDILEKECLNGSSLPKKSPSLSGILSAIVPGAGQVYAGHYRDGLVAFLLNSAFIWGAIESFHRDNNTAGGILIFFELGWYTGNIYSAVNGSHRYNMIQNRTHAAYLKDSFPDLFLTDRILLQFSLPVP